MRLSFVLSTMICITACGPELESTEPLSSSEQSLCNDPDGCSTTDPGETSAPKPATPKLTARSASSLSVDLKLQTSWTSWALQRRVPGGTWATASSGNTPTSTTRTVVDTGRPADSRWCYRLKATNSAGTGYSSEQCGLTWLQSAQNPLLATLALKVKVANVTDAGTDARIGVRLNALNLPGHNFTGLSRAIDDFERNTIEQYVLMPDGLQYVRDITELTLTNYNSDGVCIESIELFANDAPIFSRTFGSSTCRWIDSDAPSSPTLTIPFEELRASASFVNFSKPPLIAGFSKARLASLIEGIVGNAIWVRDDVDWGDISGAAVEVSRANDDTVHVDLVLEGIANNAPNPEIDIDFDLRFSFSQVGSAWKVNIDVLYFRSDVDFAWWTEALGEVCWLRGLYYGQGNNCMTFIEDYIEEAVARGVAGKLNPDPIYLDAAQLQQLGCTAGARPTVGVEPDGSVNFACR